MRSRVRTASLAVAACTATGLLASCASANNVPVVAGKTTSTTPSATSSATRPAKPAAEHVPDSKVLTVALQIVPGSATSTSGQRSVTLTDPAKIAQIAAEINALPTLPTYPKVYCPMEIDGPYLVLVFRDSVSGPVLAQVRLEPRPSGVCGPGVQVTVGGVTEPKLDDSGQPKLYSDLVQTSGLTTR
ncbi:hypothetical protein [Actinospica sp.]|jgi:hypothetical protein|uniref:hypothetical protein n=1 Tax=Actinospica sp. TaxID=1872142 RepID=UPI002CC3DAEC|nr:hypothetical protein [Actinospica sp.]HWG26968.1 hypothetical protein [Actinospica sp.]